MAGPVLKLQYRNTFIDASVEEQDVPDASRTSRRSCSLPPRMDSMEMVSEETYLNTLTEMLKDCRPASLPSMHGEALNPAQGPDAGELRPGKEAVPSQLPSPGTLGHPEVCRRPCMHFLMGHCLNGTACNFCHAAHPEKAAKLDKKQRLQLQAMRADEFSAMILGYVLQRVAMAPLAAQEAADDLLKALSAKAGNASWPAMLERDQKNLKKTLAKMNVSNLIGVLTHKFSKSEHHDKGEQISIAMEKLRWHFVTEEI